MPITVTCQFCERQFTAKDEHAGKKSQCLACGQSLTIPDPRRPTRQKAKPKKPQEYTCCRCDGRFSVSKVLDVDGTIICTECFAAEDAEKRKRIGRRIFVGVSSVLAAAAIAAVIYFRPAIPWPTSTGDRSSASIVKRTEGAVALVRGEFASGTGFMVSKDVLATNTHVIQAVFVDDIKVYFPSAGEEEYRVESVLHDDETRDLCLLRVSANRESLPLAKRNAFQRGEDIIIIGNPGVGTELILQNAVTKGLLSSETIIDGMLFYQISASINPGNSGGPVLNTRGQVVAIVTLRASQQEGIAFGIPVAVLYDAISEVRRKSEADLQAVNDRFAAKVLFRWMGLSGLSGLIVMDTYVQSWSASIRSGSSAVNGLNSARTMMSASLAELDQIISGRMISQRLRALQRSTALDSKTRNNLLDLWVCVSEVKRYVDEPKGSYNFYSAKASELRDEFDRLVDVLQIQLDTDLGTGG